MSEQPLYNVLICDKNQGTIDTGPPDSIRVSRAELLHEYGLAVARAQHLSKLLGLPPLMTGQQLRKQR